MTRKKNQEVLQNVIKADGNTIQGVMGVVIVDDDDHGDSMSSYAIAQMGSKPENEEIEKALENLDGAQEIIAAHIIQEAKEQ